MSKLDEPDASYPLHCTKKKSTYYFTKLQKSALFTQEADFPTSEWNCMYSVIAKLQNEKWKGQKNQFIEHSDLALMCSAAEASQYKPIINVSDQPTNSLWL